MAKKEKRSVSRVEESAAPVASRGRVSVSSEFNPDYSYIIKDLKRIGTLAVVFFVVLVALSFVL
ncbi:hypothetical protein ADN00_03075 [Ornatilinea apprima]|uniref:Uncharacterized protein n=1 Tax=Ornatilinea apprima TaxID=1134406 RepID=A0A0P6YBL7_9CHLR|nr:hypothetical protein [Ornatilinea apprima]KPL79326.1 hypothetical protein ADN00_03075 [Ornatilinea apprima]